MKIAALNLHPLKSGRVRPVTSAPVGPAGLQHDRTWMAVDAEGALVSARECAELLTIVADTPVTDASVRGVLRLSREGLEPLSLSQPETAPVLVTMFGRNPMTAWRAGPTADAWLQHAIGRPGIQLVWCPEPQQRQLNPEFSRAGDHTAFADGYPVTIVSQSSLDRLNDLILQEVLTRGEEMAEPLAMARFRPNVVVGDSEAFAEDFWSRIAIAGVECRVVKSVDRCVMTTIDADSLTRGPEPIRSLATHRKWDGKTWFARHVIPEGSGEWAVGDEVTVLG